MQNAKEKSGLVWFTNNLRVYENPALKYAIEDNDRVIGVYFFDPSHFAETKFGFRKTGCYRAKFLIESISQLKKNLERINIILLVYLGKPEDQIPFLVKEFQINAVFFQKEWTSEEDAVIRNVKKSTSPTLSFKGFYSQLLFHPDDIPFGKNSIPYVFTDFRKKCEKYCDIKPLEELHTKLPSENNIENTTSIPSLRELGFNDFEIDKRTAFPFLGGEDSAQSRLEDYFFESKSLANYKKTRNGLLGAYYSSKLSAWLANGSISPKYIYWKVKEFEEKYTKNESTYWLIFELIWRDFFKYTSMKYGNDFFKIGGILKKDYSWHNNQKWIGQWINGETKEPFVNANMLELKNTGWMSNRGRQNVASYFAKELHLDWRIGAAYFESLLIDYDVHSNYGNWM